MTPDGLRELARRLVIKSYEVLNEAKNEVDHVQEVGMIGRAQGLKMAAQELKNAAEKEEGDRKRRKRAAVLAKTGKRHW